MILIDRLISCQNIKHLCWSIITGDVVVQKERTNNKTKGMPTPLHGKTSVVTKKVSYTTQFGYLAVWEASEVFASIGH